MELTKIRCPQVDMNGFRERKNRNASKNADISLQRKKVAEYDKNTEHDSSLFSGIVVFPELQTQKIPKLDKLCEKKLQKILALNNGEFQKLKNSMSPLQFKGFMNYALKKEKHMKNLPQDIEEKSEPIPREPRTLREKMRVKGWVMS